MQWRPETVSTLLVIEMAQQMDITGGSGFYLLAGK